MLWVFAEDDFLRRQMVVGLGQEPFAFETAMQPPPRRAHDPREREAQIRAWAAGVGGEIG